MPKIITVDLEKLTQGEDIKRYLGQECMFPHLIVIKGDEKIAIYATRLMAEHSHDGMVLEYSVFTNDNNIFRFIEKYGYAFNYHHNEPTTWGLAIPRETDSGFINGGFWPLIWQGQGLDRLGDHLNIK
ncbi:MAG: hypothetical protein JRI72_17340 [Deltaproteobacteria bacterium]|nr:hypothetical protein [Deltaproteobacteria bacterium]